MISRIVNFKIRFIIYDNDNENEHENEYEHKHKHEHDNEDDQEQNDDDDDDDHANNLSIFKAEENLQQAIAEADSSKKPIIKKKPKPLSNDDKEKVSTKPKGNTKSTFAKLDDEPMSHDNIKTDHLKNISEQTSKLNNTLKQMEPMMNMANSMLNKFNETTLAKFANIN